MVRISLKPFWRRGVDVAQAVEGPMAGAGVGAESRPASAPQEQAEAQRAFPGARGHGDTQQAVAAYESALHALAGQPGESVALSVQVPFCASHCLFCDRKIHAAQPSDVISRYVRALGDEAALLSQRIGRDRDVLQLHLGGGSANDLSDAQLIRLVDALQAAWRLPSDAEMSVEYDPRRVFRQHLELMRGLGFRHVTFGVADLDRAVQQAIGRCNSPALIEDVCAAARGAGFERIQLQLLMGLPHQSGPSWRATLDGVIAMAPDRVSLMPYQHRPEQAPGQHAIDNADLPDEALRAELQTLASKVLRGAGYVSIGGSQFVLDEDELAVAQAAGRLRRNLIGYTATPATPLIGLGAGAVGEIGGSRFWNHAALPDWHAALVAQRLPVACAGVAGPGGLH
jgi:oxygen-independent coproporphyrinogen-3 oxidase